jgi:alkylhydroperoxidase family enzyme
MPRKTKQPRISPLVAPYDDEQVEVLERLGPPIALFRVFARRPDLARGIAGWGRYYLSRQSALTVRQRELVIDRVTARCGADYEWGVHIAAYAEKAGLGEAQVRSLANGTHADDCWTEPADRAVLAAVDQLHDTHDLDDPTWTALVEAVGEDGALDVLLVAGWYHAISYGVRALRLPMEPGTPTLEYLKRGAQGVAGG